MLFRSGHFDRRITVNVPLDATGAYKITANVEGGNTTSIVYWLNDTTLVKLPTDGGQMYYMADSVSGKPIPNGIVDFFGFRQTRTKEGKVQYLVKQFVKTTDAKGIDVNQGVGGAEVDRHIGRHHAMQMSEHLAIRAPMLRSVGSGAS